MIYEPALLDQLEEFGGQEWEGTVYRHMFGSYSPARMNTLGARWNPREVAALYASLERKTVLAEADYRISLEPFRPKARRTLYRISVRLRRVVDLRDPADLALVGITDVELVADDFTSCQKVGGAAQLLGNDGLLVPSARADGVNLVIYPNDDYEFDVIDSEEISDT